MKFDERFNSLTLSHKRSARKQLHISGGVSNSLKRQYNKFTLSDNDLHSIDNFNASLEDLVLMQMHESITCS